MNSIIKFTLSYRYIFAFPFSVGYFASNFNENLVCSHLLVHGHVNKIY